MPDEYTQDQPKQIKENKKKEITLQSETKINSTKIKGKEINLFFNKKIYNNSAYDIVNKDFSEFMDSKNNINTKKLFEIYHNIFYSIPKSGKLSHETIIKQSEDYFYNFNIPKDSVIEEYLQEIERRLNDLTDLETPSTTFSLFTEGTFLKQEGSTTVYIIHKGVKRAIYNSRLVEIAKTVFGKRNIPIDELSQVVDPETLNEIPTGPNINLSSDFSIPLEQFDEPEELTTTELTDLVDEYTFTLSNTQGAITIKYKGLSPVGLFPEPDTKTIKISQFENNPITISILKPPSPSGKPFISITNDTDDPIEDVLTIINSDTGQNVPASTIAGTTITSPFIPMHLEWGSSTHPDGQNWYTGTTADSNLYAGYFAGKKIETRLITPTSPNAPNNIDIQTIFNNPVSDYYKWEMKVGSSKSGLSRPSGQRGNIRTNRYNQLYDWERVYGRPIYNFIINKENIRWYWTLIKDKTVNNTNFKYYLELSTMNFSYINNTVYYKIMGNGNYQFQGTKNVGSRRLIEVRDNDFRKIYKPDTVSNTTWGIIDYAGYSSKYSNTSAASKKEFIQPELVYPGFKGIMSKDARVAFEGPYDFI